MLMSITALNLCSFVVINYLLIFVYAFTQNVRAFSSNTQILEPITEFRDLQLIQEQLICNSNAIYHKLLFSLYIREQLKHWNHGFLFCSEVVETSQQADLLQRFIQTVLIIIIIIIIFINCNWGFTRWQWLIYMYKMQLLLSLLREGHMRSV
jgi:uncharacterized protein (DUF983 family)